MLSKLNLACVWKLLVIDTSVCLIESTTSAAKQIKEDDLNWEGEEMMSQTHTHTHTRCNSSPSAVLCACVCVCQRSYIKTNEAVLIRFLWPARESPREPSIRLCKWSGLFVSVWESKKRIGEFYPPPMHAHMRWQLLNRGWADLMKYWKYRRKVAYFK